MTPEQILQRRLEQQCEWVPLAGGIRVRVRRPYPTDLAVFLGGSITAEQVVKCVEAWEHVTEATLLGAAVGSEDPVEFNRELWADYVRDNPDAYVAVAKALAEGVAKAAERLKGLQGN